MREAFVQAMLELAAMDRRVMLLTGDLGFAVLERFSHAHPDRFLNVGVAEANMIGLATGLADCGFLPFAYSIGTFASMRGYEQIRNGPALQRLPVRIVGIGGGFGYGHAGPTHYALEDVGIMRLQPAMTVVAPADPAQTRAAILATYAHPGPVYYSIGKGGNPTIPGLEGRFRLGGLELVRAGADVLITATGAAAIEATRAAELLATHGVQAAVAIVACLRPAPTAELLALLRGHALAIAVEDHYQDGGLGSLLCETVAENGLGCRVLRCGVAEAPNGVSGSTAYLRATAGISAERLCERILAARRNADFPLIYADNSDRNLVSCAYPRSPQLADSPG